MCSKCRLLLFNDLFAMHVLVYHSHLQLRGFRTTFDGKLFCFYLSLFVLHLLLVSHFLSHFTSTAFCRSIVYSVCKTVFLRYQVSQREKSIIIMQTSNSFMFYYSSYFVALHFFHSLACSLALSFRSLSSIAFPFITSLLL